MKRLNKEIRVVTPEEKKKLLENVSLYVDRDKAGFYAHNDKFYTYVGSIALIDYFVEFTGEIPDLGKVLEPEYEIRKGYAAFDGNGNKVYESSEFERNIY